MSSSEPASAVLTVEELERLLTELGTSDLLRLQKIAVARCRGRPIDPEDLLQEALAKALEGSRKCPRDVDVVRFLAGAMRSIASGWMKARARRPTLTAVSSTGDAPAAPMEPTGQGAHLEDELIVEDLRERVLALFDDDVEAQVMVEGMIEGMEGEELRSCTDLDQTAFASKRRLIRRRIDKAFPEGWKP